MVSVFRVALGRCSCTDPQPSYVRQLVCRELTRRLSELREKRVSELAQLPQYAETVESIEGREVTFETIRESFAGAESIVVVRAFSNSWSRPNWISLSGVGHMFADGFILRGDGTKETAADEHMWGYR